MSSITPKDRMDSISFQRGETRIECTRRADGRFWLKVNCQEPTPISVGELADLVYWWSRHLRDHGLYPHPISS